LPRAGPVRRETQPVHDVVEPTFHDAQEHLAGVFRRARGDLEVTAKLPLEDAVETLEFLLLAKSAAVLARLTAAEAVHARRLVTPIDRALRTVAPAAFQVQLDALTAAQPANRIEMAAHRVRGQKSEVRLHAAFFRGAAAVVRQRRYVFDGLDVQAGGLGGGEGGLAARAGTFHAHFVFFETELGGFLRRGFGSTLGRKRRAFPAALEAHCPRRGEAKRVAVRVG